MLEYNSTILYTEVKLLRNRSFAPLQQNKLFAINVLVICITRNDHKIDYLIKINYYNFIPLDFIFANKTSPPASQS